MIGRISNPPLCSNNNISRDKGTHLDKNPLINQVTKSIINVRNTHADFRIVSKELSLYREVKDNSMLATIADTHSHNNQNARFHSLGMAVTTIANLGKNGEAKEKSVDICNKNPLNKSVDLNRDFALSKRGHEYLNQFLAAETPLDSTNYATGLRVGSDMKNNVLDNNIIDQFNSTWEIRLVLSR